ncbi:MAG TPA: PQQ-binding-like beta-propeller repeat protein, partial [Candidatus Acidoferrales bacterium]|nr:PQQ-binding-like beta-propeller repeat protein [Candidatus Acidoferrales bacterium]
MRGLGSHVAAALLSVTTFLFAASGCNLIHSGASSQAVPANAAKQAAPANVDDARLRTAAGEPQNWLTHGGTYGEQRFSALDQINAENVSKLGLAWSYDTNTTRGLEATPLVVDGVIYTTGSWSVVYAVDAKTGKEIWKYDPQVPRETGPKACCDVVNRGVALYKGKVFVGTLDGRLVALDAGTGKVVWEVVTVDPSRPYTITGAPRVVEGKVIIGNGGAELGVRGYVSAYEGETGKMAWRFYTVPGDPSQPFESPALERAAKTWK